MSLSIGELVGYVELDTRGVDRGVSKMDGALGKTRSGFSGLAKFAAGAFAAVGAVNFFKDAFGEAEEAMKVGRQTEAVIKSTGGAAKVTAGHVGDLASKISAKTGIDDEAIQSGQNLLLTFKNIKNEAGKGNDIFDQTSKAMVDMSAAMGTDAKGSAIQLGKALNDPVKGLSALSRVGVSFTKGQEKQIKSMAESGNIMGAQKIILKELNSQFGGTAASIATPADKAKVAWGNLKEQIGTRLMPVVATLATFATGKLIPAVSSLVDKLAGVGSVVKGVFSSFTSGSGKLSGLSKTFSSVFGNIKAIVADAVTIALALWRAFGPALVSYARATFGNLMAIVRGGFKVIAGIFKVVSSLIKGDWKGVWAGIKQILSGAWGIIKALVKQGWALIKLAFSVGGTAIKAIFGRIWDGIKTLVGNGVDSVVGAIKGIPGKLRALGGAFADAGRSILQKFIDGMKNAAGIITGIAGNVWDSVRGLLNGAIDRINAALEFTIDPPGPGSVHVNPANIPHLATGGRGRANSPMLATIFDANEPETVLRDSQLAALMKGAAAAAVAAAGGGSGRNAPLIGSVYQAPGEDANTLAERLWHKTRTRG